MISYKRKQRLINKKIGKEYIVIDPIEDRIYLLNETAETIFKYLYKKRNIHEIAKKVCQEYQIEYTKAFKDIKSFIKNLVGKLIFSSSKNF